MKYSFLHVLLKTFRIDWLGVAVELGTEKGDGYDAINGQITGTYKF